MTDPIPQNDATFKEYAKRVYASFKGGRNTYEIARAFNLHEHDADRLVYFERARLRIEKGVADNLRAKDHFRTILTDLESIKRGGA